MWPPKNGERVYETTAVKIFRNGQLLTGGGGVLLNYFNGEGTLYLLYFSSDQRITIYRLS